MQARMAGGLAARAEPAIPGAEPDLRLPGDVADVLRQALESRHVHLAHTARSRAPYTRRRTMGENTAFVGLDVHKEAIAVTVAEDPSG